jgi:hypothetical protein
MKIIESDNFARESVADHLVADNITSEAYAIVMRDALQAKFGGENSQSYFQVKPDDYVLWRGMEELV